MDEQEILSNRNPGEISALTPRVKRFLWLVVMLTLVMGTSALVLNAFDSSITYFYSPTEVAEKKVPEHRAFRLGGMVEAGSLKRAEDGVTVSFGITDTANIITATYKGVLPDLFAEGKGVVAQGKLESDGIFHASQVLAKHDENYVAPEAKAAIDDAHKKAIMKSLQ
ncbi:MAG: cytochrome c maturation protein CcmE [Burkholderiales bacterium]|jgi:cytochrome c-type biogenesis protein CcmE|nr:cytochrome c maturation protein CcmE [Burkholderiales bacterium]